MQLLSYPQFPDSLKHACAESCNNELLLSELGYKQTEGASNRYYLQNYILKKWTCYILLGLVGTSIYLVIVIDTKKQRKITEKYVFSHKVTDIKAV